MDTGQSCSQDIYEEKITTTCRRGGAKTMGSAVQPCSASPLNASPWPWCELRPLVTRLSHLQASQPSASPSPPQSDHSPPASRSVGVCARCQGSGRVLCPACSGAGQLTRAGYNKSTTLPKDLMNTKWTAMQSTLGWRHFRVMQQRKGGRTTLVFLLMQASCDATVQLWVGGCSPKVAAAGAEIKTQV
ncbi:hypothetical protein QJQ45_023461 [Haematococcus lacustris]|nr:hypothetical protein QJQ45_023461 [Haematococcus lacustris]